MTGTEQEYKRLRKNLLQSIRGYSKQGIYVAFFKVPAVPKKITEGSLRRLQKTVDEWKYITGRGTAEGLPARVSKIEAGILQQSRNLKELGTLRISEDEFEEINKDNPEWANALDDGYEFDDIPDAVSNEAIQFYDMAQEAIFNAQMELSKKRITTRQRNYWRLVLWRGNFAIDGFTDIDLQKKSTLFSFNVREKGVMSDMIDKMTKFLYESGQTEFELYDTVIDSLVFEPDVLTFEKKKQLAKIKEDLGLT